MIRKRQVILLVILLVALNLAISVAHGTYWNHVEIWNFSLNSKGWNNVEYWSFTLNSAASWNHVESWSFSFSSKGWNTVESWNFTLNSISSWNSVKSWSFSLANETLSWNPADETTIITAHRGWLPILVAVLIVVFTSILMIGLYAKKKSQKEVGALKLV